jgi:hypothetical protein
MGIRYLNMLFNYTDKVVPVLTMKACGGLEVYLH